MRVRGRPPTSAGLRQGASSRELAQSGAFCPAICFAQQSIPDLLPAIDQRQAQPNQSLICFRAKLPVPTRNSVEVVSRYRSTAGAVPNIPSHFPRAARPRSTCFDRRTAGWPRFHAYYTSMDPYPGMLLASNLDQYSEVGSFNINTE